MLCTPSEKLQACQHFSHRLVNFQKGYTTCKPII